MWRYQEKTFAPGFERQIGAETQLLAKKERQRGQAALHRCLVFPRVFLCQEGFLDHCLPASFWPHSEVTSSEERSLTIPLKLLAPRILQPQISVYFPYRIPYHLQRSLFSCLCTCFLPSLTRMKAL